MLTATDHDGPALNTRIRTAQYNITEDLTPPPQADTVTPDITTVKDTPDAMLRPLTADRLHALCNAIVPWYDNNAWCSFSIALLSNVL